MPTRFNIPYEASDPDLQANGGGKLTVLLDSADDAPSVVAKAADALVVSRQCLDNVITALEMLSEFRYASEYIANAFDLEPDPADDWRLPLAGMLKEVRNGLYLETVLKVGETTRVKKDGTTEIVAGYINTRRPGSKPQSPHRTTVSFEGTNLDTGRIHLNATHLDPKTLIHEASHKYIGTEDYCYLRWHPDRSEVLDDRHWTELGSERRASGLSASDLLITNADSIACLTVSLYIRLQMRPRTKSEPIPVQKNNRVRANSV